MNLKTWYKKQLLFILFFCGFGYVQAQHRSFPFTNTNTNVNHLALESDLPRGFEPIFPDTTVHVLFNQARAISYGRNFTYPGLCTKKFIHDQGKVKNHA